MALPHETVRHVAHLARLALSADDEARFSRQLGDILGYVERLQSLDVENVEPMSHPVASGSSERPDELRDSLPVEQVLAAAPQSVGEGVAVPRIIE